MQYPIPLYIIYISRIFFLFYHLQGSLFPVITMDLTGTKVVVLVLLGLIKLASGLLPLVLTRILRRKSDRGLRKFIG